MWTRFASSFTNRVDAKGRVSLPAPFRKVLEARGAEGWLVLVPGFRQKGCIEGYPPDEFGRIADWIDRMHPASEKRVKLERRVISRAMPVQLDDNGRLALPAAVKARIPAGSEAMFVGMSDRFEVWEAEAYEAFLEDEDDEDGNPLADIPWPGPDGEGA